MALALSRCVDDPLGDDIASRIVSLAHRLGGIGVECAPGK